VPHCHMEYRSQKMPWCLQRQLLKELAKEIPEAKWEINSTRNDPYPSALCNEETLGLNKARNLPSGHLNQTPQGPQDKTSTLDPPQSSDKAAQHSSTPNLIRQIGGTDGSP
jgi:hypothetical protein